MKRVKVFTLWVVLPLLTFFSMALYPYPRITPAPPTPAVPIQAYRFGLIPEVVLIAACPPLDCGDDNPGDKNPTDPVPFCPGDTLPSCN